MPRVAEMAGLLAERMAPAQAAVWDPVGLQLGDPAASVSIVGVCHEVTEDVVAWVEESPVDLLVAYHPLLFHPMNRMVAGRSSQGRALRLLRAGVSLVVTHTDFDAAEGGAADALAHGLSLSHIEPFGADEEGLPAIGRVGRFGFALDTLDARVSDAFGSYGLRISGDRDRVLDRVAVVPGAGSDLIERAAEVADALVTGDVPHHRAVRALDLGLAVVDPGHVATERPGIRALVAMVSEVVDAAVVDLTGFDPETWS